MIKSASRRRVAPVLNRICALVVAGLAGACSSSPTAQPFLRADVALPTGFQPEGITAGRGSSSFFVGSIPTGAVFRGDTRTGEGVVIIAGRPGRSAIGLQEAGGRLYVAGGATGQAFVYDAVTGNDISAVVLTTRPSFVNDVVVTSEGAFFTDSLNPVVYRLDLVTMAVSNVPLGGDIAYKDGFNANGIEATADGATLLIAQTNTGLLFRVDPHTGTTQKLEVTGESSLPGADGLLLDGRTLYVVQNLPNRIAVVRLSPDLTTAVIDGDITDPRFDAPTTVASLDGRLYVVNARVGVAAPAVAAYRVIAVEPP